MPLRGSNSMSLSRHPLSVRGQICGVQFYVVLVWHLQKRLMVAAAPPCQKNQKSRGSCVIKIVRVFSDRVVVKREKRIVQIKERIILHLVKNTIFQEGMVLTRRRCSSLKVSILVTLHCQVVHLVIMMRQNKTSPLMIGAECQCE